MRTQKLWLNSLFAIALLVGAGWSHHAWAGNMKVHLPIDESTGKPMDTSSPPQSPQSPQADGTHLLIDQRTGKPFPGQHPISVRDTNAESPAFLRAQQQCGFPKSRPYLTKYRDLTGVVLDVYVPDLYIEAQKCLGREEECISESRFGSEDARKKALNTLLIRSKGYRPPLQEDHLVRTFSDMLKQALMPYVLPDQNCKAPDLVVVAHGQSAEPYMHMPNVLTVRVDLSIIEDTKPPIAVLSFGTYRLDPQQKQVWASITGHATAIPLDLSDDEIIERIARFAQYFQITDEKGVEE